MTNPEERDGAKREASLTQVVVVALLPALIYAIGQGAIIPIIPAVVSSMGGGIEFAGFIAGAIMIGQTLGNIPAGPFVSRFGEKRAMIAGSALSVIGTLIAALAPAPWVLLVGILVIGFSGAIFNLARHAFLTTYAPLKYRARVLSTLGGTLRAGFFVGPLLSAAVITLAGLAHAAFWILVVCSVLVVVVLLVAPDVERMAGTGPARASAEKGGAATIEMDARDGDARKPRTNVWSALVEHRGVLLRLGVAAGIANLLRGARNVILPLWALSIGLDDSSTALVIGISGGIDFVLFFTSGWIMDRFGRQWSAVPCMTGLGIGLVALAFVHDVPGAVSWFVGVAVWLGLCNGIGSGIVMTIGADVAPRDRPAPFLGAWHLITDASSAAVPFIIAGVTALFALPVTAGVLGALGFVGAGMMARWIPRYLPRRR